MLIPMIFKIMLILFLFINLFLFQRLDRVGASGTEGLPEDRDDRDDKYDDYVTSTNLMNEIKNEIAIFCEQVK